MPRRLCGEYGFKYTHRAGAENAEVAQRPSKGRTGYATFAESCKIGEL
jgi:hypothetical protein